MYRGIEADKAKSVIHLKTTSVGHKINKRPRHIPTTVRFDNTPTRTQQQQQQQQQQQPPDSGNSYVRVPGRRRI